MRIYKQPPPAPDLDFKKGLHATSGNWYKVVQKLGEGGNGVTYLVLGTSGTNNGHLYALKLFKRIDHFGRKKRFLKEIKFLSNNNHPSIMRLADTGSYSITGDSRKEFAYPYYLADYIPFTLSDVIRENNKTTVEKASFVVQLLSALDHISRLGTPAIHRDIKPDNIFVKGQTCILGDFGLMTRDSIDQKSDRGVLSESKKPAVPYFYRTPDIIEFEKSGARLTISSDIFQLGLVVAQLFTGRNPMKRPNGLLEPIEMEGIGDIPGSLGGSVSSLIARMLRFNPEKRPTAGELLDPWREVFWEASKMAIELNGKAM